MDAVRVMARGLHSAMVNVTGQTTSVVDLLRRDKTLTGRHQQSAIVEPRSTRGLRCRQGPGGSPAWPYGSAIVNGLKQVGITVTSLVT